MRKGVSAITNYPQANAIIIITTTTNKDKNIFHDIHTWSFWLINPIIFKVVKIANGVGSVGNIQMLHPKDLGLSLVVSRLSWWTIYKFNLSYL